LALRRGFKSQCERRSVEIRNDLNLTKVCPLLAHDLAKHINVTVWSTQDIDGLTNDDHRYLSIEDDDCWSALTMRMETNHLIIYKSGQSAARINSVVMHELSHVILGHELADAVLLDDGSLVPDNFSQDQEAEADWFGGTLLLPRPALLKIVKDQTPDRIAQEHYGVSSEMLVYRTRMTGVRYQMKNGKR